MLELNKIYNMDCMDGMKQIEDNSIDLVLTDPPYNILNYENIISSSNKKVIRNVDFDKPKLNINQLMLEINRVLKDGGTFYIFCADRQLGKYISCCINGLKYSNTLIWYDTQGHPSMRKRAFTNHSQYIAYGHKEIDVKYTFNWLGEKKMGNVLCHNGCTSFEYGKVRRGIVGEWLGHPTQKPVVLIRRLIKISSNPQDIVLDPFIGVGTTVQGCKELNRNFIGFEISKKYCDIANKRLKSVPERLDNWIDK